MPLRNRLLRRVKRHARFGRLARQPAADDGYRPVSPQPPADAPVVRARLVTERDQRVYARSVPAQQVVATPERPAVTPPAAVQRAPRQEPQPPPGYPARPEIDAPSETAAAPPRPQSAPPAAAPPARDTTGTPSAPRAPAASPPPVQRAPRQTSAAPSTTGSSQPPPAPAAGDPTSLQPPARPADEDAPSEEEQASWSRLQSIMRAHKQMEDEGREPEVKRNIEAPWLQEAVQKADQRRSRRRRKTSRPSPQEPPPVQRTGRRTEVTYVKPGGEGAPTQVPAPPPLRPRPVIDTPGESASGETPPVQRTPSGEPVERAPEQPPAGSTAAPASPAARADEAPADDGPRSESKSAPPIQRSEIPSAAGPPASPEQPQTSTAADPGLAADAPPEDVAPRPAEIPSSSAPATHERPAAQRRPADTLADSETARQTSPPDEAAAAPQPPEQQPDAEPPIQTGDETIIRRSEHSAAAAEPSGQPEATGGPSLDKVWPVQQQAPDASSRLELVDDPAEIVPDRPSRPFRERETEEDAPVRDVLRQVESGQKSRAKIETLMPRLPRPQNAPPPRAKSPTESKPRVQRSEPPEIEMIETEIGELPSDLWTLLGQPVPGKEKPAGEAPSAPSGESETASPAGRQVARAEKSEPALDAPESRTPPAPEVQPAAGSTESAPPVEPEAPADAPAAGPPQQVARTPEEERDDGPKVKGAPPRTPPTAERAPTRAPRPQADESSYPPPMDVQVPSVDVPVSAPRIQRAESPGTGQRREGPGAASDIPAPDKAPDELYDGPVVDASPRTEGRLAAEFPPAPALLQRQARQRDVVAHPPPPAGPAAAVLPPPERVADTPGQRPEPVVQRARERDAGAVETHRAMPEQPVSRPSTDEALQRAIARAEAPPEGSRSRRREEKPAPDGAEKEAAQVDRPVIQRTIELPRLETEVLPDRGTAGDEGSAEEPEVNVDKLAREVYREIKRRLDVERERGRGLFG